MNIIVKRSANQSKINKWLVFAIVIFVSVSFVSYFILNSGAKVQQNNALYTLNAECASYAQLLTGELAANSSACQQAKYLNVSNSTFACGAVFYCAYSYSCSVQPPMQNNSLSCLCDALKSSSIVASGLCFKQKLS